MKNSISFHAAIELATNAPLTLDFANPFVGQIQAHLEAQGDLRRYDEFCLVGQPVGCIAQLVCLELACGLPTVTLYGFGRDAERVGNLSLADYRHNVVRSRRTELSSDRYDGITVLDGGGRGLTPDQMTQLQQQLGAEDIRVIDVSLGHIDPANPTAGVIDKIISSGVSADDLGNCVFVPPGFGLAALTLATTIYGLCEVWPRTVRLNRVDNDFVVAEVVDVQSQRQWGAQLGASWEAGTAPVSVPRDLLKKVIAALGEGDLTEQLQQLM